MRRESGAFVTIAMAVILVPARCQLQLAKPDYIRAQHLEKEKES